MFLPDQVNLPVAPFVSENIIIDLLAKGSYEEAMQRCQVIFHAASPFVMKVDDPQKQLIEPAQLGDGCCGSQRPGRGSLQGCLHTFS